jgi:hypothetical protein
MWYWFCSVDVVLILFCRCGIDSVLSMWYWFCSVYVVLILFCRCGIDSYHIDRTESIPHRQNRINTTSIEQNQYHIDRTESIPHRQNRINTTSTEQNQYPMWYWFCSVDVVLILFCRCGINSVLSMWYWFCSVDVVLILFGRCGIDSRINTTSTEQNQYHIDRTESIPHRQNRINTTSTEPNVLSMWYWFCSVDVVLILFCQCGIDSVLSMWYWFCWINTTSTEQNQYHIDRTESNGNIIETEAT